MKRFLIAATLMVTPVQAEPPPNATGEFSQYYKSLEVPYNEPAKCCGEADCREVEVKRENGQWWAFVTKEVFGETAPDGWIPVPPEAVIQKDTQHHRPMAATLCWMNSKVRCFDRPVTGA